jgi:hypothetical protein
VAPVRRRFDILRHLGQLKQSTQELEITSAGRGDMEVGTVVLWPTGGDPPAGYLPADGSNVSRTEYASLFRVYGTDFGSGNGSTTFGLPNLGGEPAGFQWVVMAA